MIPLDPAETRVLATLRKSVFLNSSRELDPGAPLGPSGLGLDSLGIVEFLVALEEEFARPLPTEAWTAPGLRTARELARMMGEV